VTSGRPPATAPPLPDGGQGAATERAVGPLERAEVSAMADDRPVELHAVAPRVRTSAAAATTTLAGAGRVTARP
jgi:hypothetical protein